MDEMTGPTDQETLLALRDVLAEADAVPPEVVAAAKATLIWRTIDSELAALTADSSDDDRRLAGVRGAGGPRMLAFESPTLALAVELGEDRRMLGHLSPAGPGHVEVRHAGGMMVVDVDEAGRFRTEALPRGPMRLRCTSRASLVETAWVLI